MQIRRKPHWLQKKVSTKEHLEMDRLLGSLQLNTVCREASCPNISECFSQKQATFLIMGKECTRSCTFCNVSSNPPSALDHDEPSRVAEAVLKLSLRHVVITSPTRDDLIDGGAEHFARTVAAIRNLSPDTVIELLVPDFKGNTASVATILAAGPNILGHNIETVPRLYSIRAGADYRRSLELLAAAKRIAPTIPTKTGIMLGLGETAEEVLSTLEDIRQTGCDFLSIGQYLAPSRNHHPVAEYIEPSRFEELRDSALAMGFTHVESAPYVRSSYHAERYRQDTNGPLPHLR
ncbi:MAG: lipoyl synthase [Geobacteraceae bacterium]|nr:lipoyl synthase [Geobacteraceae bacterium]